MKHGTQPRPAQPDSGASGSWKSGLSLGPFVLGVVTAYLLWSEYRPYVLQALPYLLLLACPVLHFFMLRGDHGHSGASDNAKRSNPQHENAITATPRSEMGKSS